MLLSVSSEGAPLAPYRTGPDRVSHTGAPKYFVTVSAGHFQLQI